MAARPQLLIPADKIGLCAANHRSRRIGLLGGTFNPPHSGHLHLAQVAKRLLNLDAVWCLVSPGNPLKANPPPPIEQRMTALSDLVVHDHQILVSDLETQLGTRYSVDTVRALRTHFPNDQFVWICGTDIAHQIQHWRHWRRLIDQIAFACIARPPSQEIVRGNAARLRPRENQVFVTHPIRSPLAPATWFWLLGGPRDSLSSTYIRSHRSLFV